MLLPQVVPILNGIPEYRENRPASQRVAAVRVAPGQGAVAAQEVIRYLAVVSDNRFLPNPIQFSDATVFGRTS